MRFGGWHCHDSVFELLQHAAQDFDDRVGCDIWDVGLNVNHRHPPLNFQTPECSQLNEDLALRDIARFLAGPSTTQAALQSAAYVMGTSKAFTQFAGFDFH
jgi:hypothetical protein